MKTAPRRKSVHSAVAHVKDAVVADTTMRRVSGRCLEERIALDVSDNQHMRPEGESMAATYRRMMTYQNVPRRIGVGFDRKGTHYSHRGPITGESMDSG